MTRLTPGTLTHAESAPPNRPLRNQEESLLVFRHRGRLGVSASNINRKREKQTQNLVAPYVGGVAGGPTCRMLFCVVFVSLCPRSICGAAAVAWRGEGGRGGLVVVVVAVGWV